VRKGIGKIFVGDVGVIVPPVLHLEITMIDTSKMTYRELCAYALECGVDIRDIIGIDHCYLHVDMIYVGDKPLPRGFNMVEHCNWCRNCFQMYRIRKIKK
jgi:hypothetical protein